LIGNQTLDVELSVQDLIRLKRLFDLGYGTSGIASELHRTPETISTYEALLGLRRDVPHLAKSESEKIIEAALLPLPIPLVEKEHIFPIGIHGGTGAGKSSAASDILTWTYENGLAPNGIASNIEYKLDYAILIRYLTEVQPLRDVATCLDESNRVIDGRAWKESLQKFNNDIVDNSRRRGTRILIATANRPSGVDIGLRNGIKMVIEPTQLLTSDGFPIYRVFNNYQAYEAYIADPERSSGNFSVYRGFHKIEWLKSIFDSLRFPKLEGYPPIQDFAGEAQNFLEWGEHCVWSRPNRKGQRSLVPQAQLLLHADHYNREVHADSICWSDSDMKRIVSVTLGWWNDRKLKPPSIEVEEEEE
jgi:hypothetical protein